LYYRINVMSLELPPIRKREGDLPLLVAHFLGPSWEIEEAAMQALEQYHWPGNIRQLLNCIERGKIMSEDHTVHMCDLPREVCDVSPSVQHQSQNDSDDLASIERAKVVDVLRREEGNKTRAAGTLGIDRRKIYRLLEKYGIKDEEVQSGS
ncbi:MAG: helix-turn-helix domain-containing protein, partial [Pirellulaceae bacterium]|nr:helix-turn-helix domain-containing protein [Pirellulaceae bacterium]